MNLLRLNSVGSVLDMEDNMVYPQLVGGLPDLNMGVDMYDVLMSGYGSSLDARKMMDKELYQMENEK